MTTTEKKPAEISSGSDAGNGRSPVFADRFAAIAANVEKVIRGKPDVVHLLVLALRRAS